MQLLQRGVQKVLCIRPIYKTRTASKQIIDQQGLLSMRLVLGRQNGCDYSCALGFAVPQAKRDDRRGRIAADVSLAGSQPGHDAV